MIKKIFLYSGIHEQLFFSFINNNFPATFADQGIYYAETICSTTHSSLYVTKLNELCQKSGDCRLPAALRDIEKSAANLKAHSLILGLFSIRPRVYAFHNLVRACKHVFPDAALHIILDSSQRDDAIFELYYSYTAFRFYTLEINRFFNARSSFCENNFSYFIKYAMQAFDSKNRTVGTIQDIAELIHVDVKNSLQLMDKQHLCFPCIPREVLSFAQTTLGENTLPLPPTTVFHWPSQLHKFFNSNYAASPHSLLGPKRRTELLEQREADNMEAARLLGSERLFDDPLPEPDWEPFLGLDETTAFNIARQLDTDFAQARMAEMDAVPTHFLQHDQRIVRQALHDACGNTAAPLPSCVGTEPEPRLSVLTLAYNHAEFIARNIESVIAQQTSFPVQHIIADDGSSDDTQKIILDYAGRYPHIVPVFRKNRSKPGWRNVQALFEMCRTEYAALCDGDDYFTDPSKLQTQVDFLDLHKNCALCFHPVKVVYEDGTERERIYPPVEELPRGIRPFYYLSDLLKCNLIQTNSVVYRWRFRNGLPEWFRPDCCPGDWYWHLLHAETGKIGFINKIMSVYNRHPKGIYYLSEVDHLKHRANVGLKEIEAYDIINSHFENKYESILLDLVNGVFADCLMYDSTRGQDDKFKPILPSLAEKYPNFARNFLKSLKITNAGK
ncbi:MAG: glycosyltransferase [Desulfovibrio sp.]